MQESLIWPKQSASRLATDIMSVTSTVRNFWKAMILNDEVSANSIMKRATKHYTIKINTR